MLVFPYFVSFDIMRVCVCVCVSLCVSRPYISAATSNVTHFTLVDRRPEFDQQYSRRQAAVSA
jgi:hypothetical protein